MAKKFLGLSMFYWVLIVLVVLFFVYGGRKVSEGFAACTTDKKTVQSSKNAKQCAMDLKCKWNGTTCYCCPP